MICCKGMNIESLIWNISDQDREEMSIFEKIGRCVAMRKKYISSSLQDNTQGPTPTVLDYKFDSDGVYSLKCSTRWLKPAPTMEEYKKNCAFLLELYHSNSAAKLCKKRLEHLKHSFLMYQNLSSDSERLAQRMCRQNDYFKVVKVDTHVHHNCAINAKTLIKYIKKKLTSDEEEIVYERNGVKYTLAKIFNELKFCSSELSVTEIGSQLNLDAFSRFDLFNRYYTRHGKLLLKEIFFKYDNYNNGKYFAELSHEVFENIDSMNYVYSENRITILGESKREWDRLSRWIVENNLLHPKIKWVIQWPRAYEHILGTNEVHCFGTMLKNFFEPLFEVTRNPKENPTLAKFLTEVVAIDSVDDESINSIAELSSLSVPAHYNEPVNPPFSYYLYYIYANLASLNAFRASKGLNTFSLRPHAGETGNPENMIYPFLTSQSISHGANWSKSVVLQYLYYICQIGISMSPLSNNAMGVVRLSESPFYDFFMKGLRVTLSTDDPLRLHFTSEPLAEEYSVAVHLWKLSPCDQCEISRNSILISNFDHQKKAEWIGENYRRPFADGNTHSKTCIPDMRLRFRKSVFLTELSYISNISMDDIFY